MTDQVIWITGLSGPYQLYEPQRPSVMLGLVSILLR